MIGTIAGIPIKTTSVTDIQILGKRGARTQTQISSESIDQMTPMDRSDLVSHTNYRSCGNLAQSLAVLASLLFYISGQSFAEDNLGVSVPDGFEVTLYADDELAHDIYSMTVDSFGRIVVSGAGYVKILIDQDKDGTADFAHTFVDGPTTGAQGMYFAGRDLLCSGDAGLLRYRDRDGDDVADGTPDVFLKVKAGGEHDLHSMRKGPDGWWYVIAGNMAGITDKYITLDTSPVKKPQAGTIMRFKPDLSGGEVITDGFRNAYDFDFGAAGDLFTFDSDGERDISLPWYRPTRVFHALSGANAGWLTESWKRPSDSFDMPPTIAEFGRGSPSGVECYQHTQFPKEYRGALFVLDWTYGRVMALPMLEKGSTFETKPIEFMKAVGQHGFAPTDVAVGADGALYVCVGGRGTRGSVYRITHKESSVKTTEEFITQNPESLDVNFCLQAPQPLSSWSRRLWEHSAVRLTAKVFEEALLERSRTAQERMRAIEILTEKFRGLNNDLVNSLSIDPDAQVRARAAWSIGRMNPSEPDTKQLERFLKDDHPLVVRTAMEALIGAKPESLAQLAETIAPQLGNSDQYVRQTAMRLLVNCDLTDFHKMAQLGYKSGWKAAIPVAGAFTLRNDEYSKYSIEIALRILKADHPLPLKQEAVRMIQLGLGDVGYSADEIAPVFEGYTSFLDLTQHEQDLDSLRITVDQLYPTGEAALDWELERVIAMIHPANDALLDEVLSKITKTSSPVDDIHRLIVISQIAADRSASQREVIADALVHLETKIKANNLRQDSNWDDRVLEIYEALHKQDPRLPIAILDNPDFGQPGHVQFISAIPADRFEGAITAFFNQISRNTDYAWNSDVIFLLAESERPEERNLIRSQFDDFALRNAVLMCLANGPEERDRKFFVEALQSAPVDTLKECVNALGLLDPSEDPTENVLLLQTLRNLSPDEEERQIRDQVAELLRRNLNVINGYTAGLDGNPQKEAIDAWTKTIAWRFPEEFAKQESQSGADPEALKEMLANVNWEQADAKHGADLFNKRGCVQCHGGRRALGPDLNGATGRFSREDLFTAIAFPHKDVSPRYQTTQIATTDGFVRTGLIVYESVDGMVLRDSNNQTYRIETEEIEARKRLSKSLMPSGLIKDLQPQDLSDLYAYLRTLSPDSTTKTAAKTMSE